MLTGIWSALLHPDSSTGRDGAGTLAIWAVAAALITAALFALMGRTTITRRPVLAFLAGVLFAPCLISGFAFVLGRIGPAGRDGAGILILGALVLSICALPVTFVTSALCVLIQQRRHPR